MHEQDVVRDLIKVHAMMLQATNLLEKAKAKKLLVEEVMKVFKLAQKYPALTSNEAYLNLKDKLN